LLTINLLKLWRGAGLKDREIFILSRSLPVSAAALQAARKESGRKERKKQYPER